MVLRSSFLLASSTLLLLLSDGVTAQSTHESQVCDPSTCTVIETSVMGGLRFEDYKVTSPKAIQFDPATRSVELAQLGSSTAQTMCQAPATFDTPAPTITFNNVQAQTRYALANGATPAQQFLDVEFANLSASNGYTSPSFGLKMTRNVTSDGTVDTKFAVAVHAGNPGLQNVVGLVGEVGYTIDPVNSAAYFYGTAPPPPLLRQAVFGVLANVYSIVKTATFSTTNSPPSGRTLWTAGDIIALAQQAQPLIAGAPDATVPIGPPFKCTYPTDPNAYAVCSGMDQMAAFENTMLQWGGEYLGLDTSQSRKILTRNLLAWAQANAPPLDPQPNDLNGAFQYANMELSKPILTLWPTLRDDPVLAASERQTIENWIVNRLMPVAYVPGGVSGAYPDRNNWGYFGASIQMADAIRRSDNQTFANAVQEFYVALNQMRQDGSFPYETSRGPCSVTYTNVDILHLTSIAEMAATQGYDLYAMNVNGKNLEAAIEYLLNARDNPSLLSQYSNASANSPCFLSSNAPLDFSDVFNNYVPSQLAWMEAYLARFPFSTTAARLRQIVGSDISKPPFPMWADYTGLNSTCSFRKSFEFKPISGVKISVGGGNNQTVAANQVTPAPLTVRVTDNSGAPLANVLVSFAVVQGSANLTPPAQVLTDASGLASARAAMGPASGPVRMTATALGVSAGFSLIIPGPAISSGGIAGVGASVPPVTTISPGALFSIYGQNFVTGGTGRRVNPDEFVNGALPNMLLGVCVSVGGLSAPLLDVYPGQINAVAPALTPSAYPGAIVEVIVTTGCGTASAVQSMPQAAIVAAAAPEFLYFAHNANGQNPVAAVNAVSGAYVGPASLGAGFVSSHPGDLVTVFAAGFGPTNPPIAPGAVAIGAAKLTSPVTVTLGNVTLDPSDILYVGAAPGELISQLNIRIPSGTPAGNQRIEIVVAGIASPPGAFLPVAVP